MFVSLSSSGQVYTLQALIVSSVDQNFIGSSLVQDLRIATHPFNQPLTTKALNGQCLSAIHQVTEPVLLCVSGNYSEIISFYVLANYHVPIVLGLP